LSLGLFSCHSALPGWRFLLLPVVEKAQIKLLAWAFVFISVLWMFIALGDMLTWTG